MLCCYHIVITAEYVMAAIYTSKHDMYAVPLTTMPSGLYYGFLNRLVCSVVIYTDVHLFFYVCIVLKLFFFFSLYYMANLLELNTTD